MNPFLIKKYSRLLKHLTQSTLLLWGYCDEQKNLTIPVQFEEAGFFKQDNKLYYASGKINGKRVLILEDGSLIEDEGDGMEMHDFGLFEVHDYPQPIKDPALSKKGKHGFHLDAKENTLRIAPVYSNLLMYFEKGQWAILLKEQDQKQGMVDTKGNILIPFEYDVLSILNREKRLFFAKKGEFYGIIDQNGKEVYPFELEELGTLTYNRILAKKGGKYGYLNELGQPVIPFNYSRALNFGSGPASGPYAYVGHSLYFTFYISTTGTEYYER